ncbi:MAG: hypothetical protein KTR31_23185 [Myxococcales bacterium]|nr:hypothetical protein [Myxococcales bacterium]
MPHAPVGEQADVTVWSGWTGDVPRPYEAPVAFEQDGQQWVRPTVLADRGWISVQPKAPEVAVRVYARSTGLDKRGFRRVEYRAGTLEGRVPTAMRFMPRGPLGAEPLRLDVEDLQNPYLGDRLTHGDLLLLEVGPDGQEPERYLFTTREFGWRTRTGAGLLLRFPQATPAITLSLAVGYRYRTKSPVWDFLGERMMLVGSVGVGSSELSDVSGPLQEQLLGAFDALLVGGGIEWFEFLSVQVLMNAAAPFDDDVRPGLTVAAGFDAVQAAKFFADAGARLLREHPMREERRGRRR